METTNRNATSQEPRRRYFQPFSDVEILGSISEQPIIDLGRFEYPPLVACRPELGVTPDDEERWAEECIERAAHAADEAQQWLAWQGFEGALIFTSEIMPGDVRWHRA